MEEQSDEAIDGFKTDFTISTRDCFTPFAMTKLEFFSNLVHLEKIVYQIKPLESQSWKD